MPKSRQLMARIPLDYPFCAIWLSPIIINIQNQVIHPIHFQKDTMKTPSTSDQQSNMSAASEEAVKNIFIYYIIVINDKEI